MIVTVTAHTGWIDPISFEIPDSAFSHFQSLDAALIAETVWQAIEAPYALSGVAGRVQQIVNGLRESGVRVFGISVGDTVRIERGDETAIATVAPVGFDVEMV